MSDLIDTGGAARPDDWPLRPWLLAALLALAGLAVHLASDGGEHTPWRMALTAFVFFAPLAAAFTIDRDDQRLPAIFSLGLGLVMAGIAWRVTSAQDHYADEQFWFAAGVLAVTLSVPLFQAGFHRDRLQTSYKATHFFVWSDAISGAGALAFTGLSWALLAILSELFFVIKISLLRDLLDQAWFGWTFSGLAFGAALGVLRNQLKIIGTLQSVVLLVLSLMAVPLAAALLLFLLAVLLSGIDVLWEATRSATPLLLACAVGAFVLTNSVVRDDDADASKSRVLRIAGFVLALGILPLSVMAAMSMGTRIAQHGLSPERIWALIAIAVAVAYGAGYFVAALRGRKDGWRGLIRQANLHLAVLTCAVALLLAMPVFNFGAISARDQVARLQGGEVTAEGFDFDALRWDFGDAGRAALVKLTTDKNPLVAKLAREANDQKSSMSRYNRTSEADLAKNKANLRLVKEDPLIRAKFERYLRSNSWLCTGPCVLIEIDDTRGTAGALRNFKLVSQNRVNTVKLNEQGEFVENPRGNWSEEGVEVKPGSTVELRSYQGRRIYVDGKPVGAPFD